MIYTASLKEISRRKKAYATLSTSILVGLFLASHFFNLPVAASGYLIVIAVICLLGAYSFRFLHKLLKNDINLTNEELERRVNRTAEKYPLSEVIRVHIKWTTNKTIREMCITFSNKKKIYISALNNFEEFKTNLLKLLNKNVVIGESHEPIDYDHPLFYSTLGLPISTVGVLVFKYIPYLTYPQIRIGMIALFAYLFALGLYFIIAKPLSTRIGKTTEISDYIAGILMIGLGCFLLLMFISG